MFLKFLLLVCVVYVCSGASPPTLPSQWDCDFTYSTSVGPNVTGHYFYDSEGKNYRFDKGQYDLYYICGKGKLYDQDTQTKVCYTDSISESICENQGNLFYWLPQSAGPFKRVINGIPCNQWSYSPKVSQNYDCCVTDSLEPVQLRLQYGSPVPGYFQYDFKNVKVQSEAPNFVLPSNCH
eukprot:TRINITY_DN16833_c0_g1_i1.p1 TRINITY_DN16833_c0_g1~~TRINITY_DN16833_c0_g1_i1.p1  ORF type:complete len:180 (-),score=18.24 TRINITY_DN16833_c0_g1_i1:90-629(-)